LTVELAASASVMLTFSERANMTFAFRVDSNVKFSASRSRRWMVDSAAGAVSWVVGTVKSSTATHKRAQSTI
jgi:hypothetical protein